MKYTIAIIAIMVFAIWFGSGSRSHAETDYFKRVANTGSAK